MVAAAVRVGEAMASPALYKQIRCPARGKPAAPPLVDATVELVLEDVLPTMASALTLSEAPLVGGQEQPQRATHGEGGQQQGGTHAHETNTLGKTPRHPTQDIANRSAT